MQKLGTSVYYLVKLKSFNFPYDFNAFFAKKGCSHLHSFWLPEKTVEQIASLKLKKYKDRMNNDR